MKTLFAIFVGAFLSVGIGLAQTTDVHVHLDAKEQLAKVFKAPKDAINQTMNWRLGIDEDFLSQKKLVEIARKNIKFPAGKNYEISETNGMEWMPIDIGWMVTVYFQASIRLPYPGATPIADGDVILAVPLLPNGAVVITEKRPLTTKEKESLQPRRSGPP